MVYDIVYTCNSINNKNIRGNELKILRKIEDQLCFEFGESENNVKKRFYRNLEELNKDYEKIEKIKQKIENEEIKKAEKIIDNITEAIAAVEQQEEIKKTAAYAEIIEPIENKKTEIFKKNKNKMGKKNIF